MNTANSLDTAITKCLPQLSIKQKRTVLTVVKTLAEQQKDWWLDISQEQQAAIDKSLLEMKEGKLTAHHKIISKYKK
jgi:post-segregation antitoxin (ccd killing protein)